MSSAVVSLVKVIPLPQFGCLILVSDIMSGVGCGVGRKTRAGLLGIGCCYAGGTGAQ